jgi:oligopeptide/dipeptide ABC transporter ATP-binding protein
MANLIETVDLKKQFDSLIAVDGVCLSIKYAQTLGLIGESGSGKTTLARMIMNLEKPTSGKIYLKGKDISSLSHNQISKKMRMIFQKLDAALNPQMKVIETLEEAITIHRKDIHKSERTDYIITLLNEVGYPISSRDSIYRYPYQLSGGEKRRIAIAKAILTNPKLIVADEPVSALDVSIQMQIMNLFIKLREDNKMAYLFISHDLNIVSHISHRIAVMFCGNIVEIGNRNEIMHNPLHPYTKKLLSAILPIGTKAKEYLKDISIKNTSFIKSQKDEDCCNYKPYCDKYPKYGHACSNKPELREIGEDIDHFVACYEI